MAYSTEEAVIPVNGILVPLPSISASIQWSRECSLSFRHISSSFVFKLLFNACQSDVLTKTQHMRGWQRFEGSLVKRKDSAP